MKKEMMLKKAFHKAMANEAIRFTDRDVDYLVIKNLMTAYLAKHDVPTSEGEIKDYILSQFAMLDETVKDFRYLMNAMY